MTNSIVGRSESADAARELQARSAGLQGQLNELFQEQISGHENRLINLEDNMRVNGIQEMNIKDKGNSTVIKVLGGKDTNAYKNKRTRSKTYSALWRRFKRRFGIPRYGELAAKDFDDAMDHLEAWTPDRELQMEIEQENAQRTLNIGD